MRLQIPHPEPLLAADIDVSKNDGFDIEIMSVDELIISIKEYLSSISISSRMEADVISGLKAKSLYKLYVSEGLGYQTLLNHIREMLNERNLDWFEPYAESSDDFRFIIPSIGIFKES